MTRGNFFFTLLFGLLCIFTKAQNGQYVTDGYLFYKTKTDANPQITKHKYILTVSISDFLGQGKITVKDVDEDIVITHTLTGKTDELYDDKTNQYAVSYYSTCSIYDFSQAESIILLFDASTKTLNCIVSKSIEFKSEGYYCGLKPIEETLPSTGSGFIVSSDGYIITNYHVVKGAKIITVSGIDGNYTVKYDAILKAYDSEKDIALLKIKSNDYAIAYTIAEKEKEVGENIFVLGYPMISLMGSEIKLTDGLISSASGFMNDKLYYQISSPIQPGNSGCPLFDSEGNVIGLVTSKLTNGENVGYALKSKVIIQFLSAHGVSKPVSNVTQLQTSLSQKVKKLKPNIITIESFRQ